MTTIFLENEYRRHTEIDLVQRVQSHDPTAFRDLVESYQAKIFSVVYRILRNREDAEDVAQQVFTKVYFSIGSFEGQCSLLAWMCKIAINECYSLFRKRRMERAREIDAPDREFASGGARLGERGADTILAARDLLDKLLAHVDGEDRMLLVMKEIEGHSIGELADFTGQSESAIKTKLFRARRKLIAVSQRLSQRTLLAPACS